MNGSTTSRRGGFTLVEMLIVIIIISILAAILIPTVYAVRKKASETRIALELSQLDKSLEAYKLKHNDYPPNFFDLNLVKRHLRNAFPQCRVSPTPIDAGANPGQFGYPNGPFEIIPGWNAFQVAGASSSAGHRPDAAECLVFWLGGLSSDPRFPFTGPGGPLMVVNGEVLATPMPERNEGFFTFDQGRVGTFNAGAGGVLSNDEVLLHGQALTASDPFPVYFPKGMGLLTDASLGDSGPPYVYFDSRSYTLPPTVTGGGYVRAFWTTGDQNNPYDFSQHNPTVPGVAAPYRTTQVNPRPNAAADTSSNPGNPGSNLYYANPKRFQIITAGLDGNFGTAMFAYNTGESVGDPTATGTNYRLPDGTAPDEDNITNFSEGQSLVRQRP